MKTNRIHSIHQKIKRCWFCNKKLRYAVDTYPNNLIINSYSCDYCTDDYFFIESSNNYFCISISSHLDHINEEYVIEVRKNNNKFNIDIFNLDMSGGRTYILSERNISLINFRRINLKDYLKTIDSFRKNKLFL